MSRYYDTLNLADSLRINNTSVIDSSRNLANIGTISTSGGISVSGNNTISSYAGSFNFITGSLTGNVTGTLTGNASSATKWQTARTLSLTGDVTGSVSIDGSANASITATVANNSHTHTVDQITGLVEGTSFSGEYASLFHIGANRLFSDASMRFRGSDSRLTVEGSVNTLTYQVGGTAVIDSSRNLINIGTINKTLVTASEGREIESYMPTSYGINSIVSGHRYGWYNDNWYIGMCRSGNIAGEDFGFDYNGSRKFGVTNTGQVEVNGTTVIDASRNITVGAITASGKLYFNKNGQTNYHSVIDIDHIENNLWAMVFQSSTVGNDNESGFWIGNNGYPDMRLRRDNGTVRALISSWETSYVSNSFNVLGGDLQVGGTTVIDSARNATVNKVTATGSGMSLFSTDLSSNDDWVNSPISIRERNMAGSVASADIYAPNLNFHWGGRTSNSLWMNSEGHLVYGTYSATGVPAADGVFAAGALRTNILTDLADTSTFLELEGDSLGMRLQTVNGFFRFGARNSTWCHMETDRSGFYFYKKINVVGTANATTGYQVNGTTVIDASRNLTNIGTVSTSGTITCGGEVNASGDIYAGGGQVYVNSGNADVKLGLWGDNSTTYGIGMTSGVTYGGLNDYAMTFCMNNDSDRGFWWGYSGQSKAVGAMSLTTAGVLTVAGTITTGTNGNISTGTGGSISAFANVTASNGFVKSGSGGFYVSSNQIVDSGRNLLNIGNITCSGTNNTYGDINIRENASAQGYTFMRFQSYSTGATLGSIYRAYGSMVYSTSSDYRLKENVVQLTGAADKVRALPVRRFNFIAHPERTVDGFLAHEVAEVVPEAVLGEKDAVDSNGKPVYQGIDQSKLVPLLTAGLQEALAEIENLKARLSALEN